MTRFGEDSKSRAFAARAGSLGAHVHNVYLLTAAENGYFGLCALLGLLLAPLFKGLKPLRSAATFSDFHLGLLIGILLLYIHSAFEWSLITNEIQYVFAIVLGLLVQSTEQLGTRRRHGISRTPNRGQPALRPISPLPVN